jgi:hypothetical protein
MIRFNPRKIFWLLTGVAVLSLAANLIGVRWGLPALWYPDEPETIEQIVIPMARHFDLNPHIFHKGSLYYYFLLLVLAPFFAFIKLFHVSSENYDRLVAQVTLIARIATACTGAFGVLVMYRIGKRLRGPGAGILAALLLAVNMVYAGYAHFAYMEVPMLVLLMVSLYWALRYADTDAPRDLRLAALFGGLAASAKYNAVVPALVFILILHVARAARETGFRAKGRRLLSKELFISIGLMGLGFVLGTPFAVLDFRTFAAYLIKQSFISREGYKVFAGSYSWAAYLDLLVKGLGAPMAIAVIGAFSAAFIQWFKDRSVKAACILFPALFYYIYIGSLRLAAIRYLLPMIPFLLLSFLLPDVWSIRKSVRILLLSVFAGICAFTAGRTFLGVRQFTSDTRDSAEKWIADHIPDGGRVEMYAYKTYLPKFPAGITAYRMIPNFVVESAGYESFKRSGFAEKYLKDASPASSIEDNREAFTLPALRTRNPDYILLTSFYDDRYIPSRTNKTLEMYPELARYYLALAGGQAGYDTAAVFRKDGMQEYYLNPTITVLRRSR